MRPSVFIVGGDMTIARMFMDNNWKVTDSIDEADLIQFTGGEDVSPMLYGDVKHSSTYCSPVRDQIESDIFFSHLYTPKAGICRGGQFLNVMSGGGMFQHVDNHGIAGTHNAYYFEDSRDKRSVQVTSTHHQMMRPDLFSDFEVFMIAELSTSKEDGMGTDWVKHVSEEDTEGVMYFDTNSLCFQPHPEYVDPYHECQQLYFEVLERFFGLEVK